MLHHSSQLRNFALVFALGAFACSSDDAAAPMTSTGPTSTTGGGQGGTGGSSTMATGGSAGSTTTAMAGSSGAGGASGGSSGAAGAAGDAAGGSGGSGGSAMPDGGAKDGAGGGSTDGGRDGSSSDGGGSDGPVMFSLSTPAFMAGGTFPRANTCANGDNSPELNWTPGPATTQGYAIVLWDTTNMFRHWVIWDIPPDTMSLPAALAKTATLAMPMGAKQISFRASPGYAGPCPPGGAVDLYEFALYAVNQRPLTGMTNNPNAAEAAVMARQIAKTTLRGRGSAN